MSETTAAIVQNGTIVAGGWACAKCGKPTLTRFQMDPFGKVNNWTNLCSDHFPPWMNQGSSFNAR